MCMGRRERGITPVGYVGGEKGSAKRDETKRDEEKRELVDNGG